MSFYLIKCIEHLLNQVLLDERLFLHTSFSLCRCWWTMKNHLRTFPMLNQINQACISLSLYAIFFNPKSFLIYLCNFKHSSWIVDPELDVHLPERLHQEKMLKQYAPSSWSLFFFILQITLSSCSAISEAYCQPCIYYISYISSAQLTLPRWGLLPHKHGNHSLILGLVFPMVCVGWHYH